MALKLFFFLIFLFKIFFLKFFKFSRHADLRGFGVAAYENMPAWRRPAAACITALVTSLPVIVRQKPIIFIDMVAVQVAGCWCMKNKRCQSMC